MRERSLHSFFSGFIKRMILFLLGVEMAHAASVPIPHGTVELLAEKQWISAGGKIDLGLRFQLEKGWSIHWMNPGDSGTPPRVTWQLPAGVTVGPMEWPAPTRFEAHGSADFGYEGTMMLVVPIHADATLTEQQSIMFSAEIQVLVCSPAMCVPGKTTLSLTLPVKPLPPPPIIQFAALFHATRKSLPQPIPKHWTCQAFEENDSFVLTINTGRQVAKAIFFPLVELQVENAAPQKLFPTTAGFRLLLRKFDPRQKPINRLKGLLVISDEPAYLVDLPVSKPPQAQSRKGTP